MEQRWEDNFQIKVKVDNNAVVVSANREGLVSLANQLLVLADDEIAIGSHFHYDEYNSLEDNSADLIIEKV